MNGGRPTINDDVIRKVMHGRHVVSLDALKGLPMALLDPIAVFDSSDPKIPNALVVMTDLKDQNGDTIILAIHVSKKIYHHDVNKIASLYGKEDKKWFGREAGQGRLRYINREKAIKWSQLTGQLFLPSQATIQGSMGSIQTENDIVKFDDLISFKKEKSADSAAFRKWFGDWERARKYKAIIDMEPVRIGAKPQTESDAETSYKALKPASNVKDGRTIHFPNSIFGKLSRHKEHALIFRTIPQFNELLHDADPAYFEAERKEERKSNVIGMQNYVSKITIDGTDYFVRFSVQEVKKPNGNELHNTFVSDVELIKADLMKGPSGHTASFNAPVTASPTSLLDKVLASFMKDVKEAYDGTAQVVSSCRFLV